MWRTTSLVALLLALALPGAATAAPQLVRVGSFAQPVHVASPSPTRLFVVERRGVVRVMRDGVALPVPFLDIAPEVRSTEGERGLLSIAFAPDYETSGLFYVYLTAAAPLGELQVREYRRSAGDPDRADPAGRIVWRQAHNQAANHNGGQVAFGPDGLLWFGTGDGGGGNDQFNHARDLSSQLGKLLRIDPRPGNAGSYTVPADNPFGTAVWAYGLRNPFRFSFDHRGTKDLFIGDVGEAAAEEIDAVRSANGLGKGADFGWACREGLRPGPKPCNPSAAYVPPIFDYAQGSPRAVVGGVVVRDPGLPTLFGRYVYADTYEGVVRSFVPGHPSATDARVEIPDRRNPLVSFGEDACGRVYVVSLAGSVDRIQDGAPTPCLPPAAAASPPPPPPPPVVDRISPRVRIQVARRGRVGSRATPRIVLTASEACRVSVTARIAGARLRPVRTPLRAGRRTVLRLRPTRRGVTRIRRALRRQRRTTLVVGVSARDAAGNTGRAQRRLRVRR